MFDKLRNILSKNSISTSFTKWFGIADFEDNQTFNLSNIQNMNAYVNIAINKIATNITRAPLQLLTESDKPIKSGAVYKLFRDVNNMMSTSQLIESTVSWLEMRGESIWILEGKTEGTITGVPKGIQVIDPQYMTHVLNKENTEIVLWKYKRNGVEVPFMPSEIIHFKQWNSIDNWRGVNPLIAAQPELMSDNLINTSNNTLLKNKGVPAGLLTSTEDISAEQAKEIKDMWNKSHGGSKNTGKTAVLGSDMKYQQLALTQSDMEYFKSKQWNRSVILGRYGVPAIAAGYKDETSALSGSDTNEQMRFFWTQTLLPKIKFIQDKLDTEFSKRFAPKVKIRFGVSEIAELQIDLVALSARVREDIKAGIMTQNEGREELGLEKVSWGNTWWKDSRLVDVAVPVIQVAPVKNSLTIFDKPTEQRWPELFIKQHIWKVESDNKKLSEELYKELKAWLYEQRKVVLSEMAGTKNFEINNLFWEQQKAFLETGLLLIMDNIRNTVLNNVKEIVNTNGVDIDFLRDDICGRQVTTSRLADIIENFVIYPIHKKDLDGTREMYKIAQSRLHEVADMEIKTIVNDMRTKIFTTLNLDKSLWIQLDKPQVNDTGLQIFNKKIIINAIPKKGIKIMEENENIVRDAVTEFYIDVTPAVAAKVKNAGSVAEITTFLDKLKMGDKFSKAMMKELETVWANGAKSVYGNKLYDLSIKKSAEFIKSRGLLLKDSPKVVTDSVINMIESKGDITVKELAADIMNKWDEATQGRSNVIAQTETTEALANGAEEAMVELEIPYKRWVNMGDDLVRDEHLDSATGVFAKVGKSFKNGMDRPGGFGCRCWLEGATEKEAKG